MCRTSVRPGKTKSDNLNLFYATIVLSWSANLDFILLFYSCELHCMYFSTSGDRKVTTKRQLDGLCSLLKLTSHIPMFQASRAGHWLQGVCYPNQNWSSFVVDIFPFIRCDFYRTWPWTTQRICEFWLTLLKPMTKYQIAATMFQL
jgi:hypothetical protein